jgi:hypothetical protein
MSKDAEDLIKNINKILKEFKNDEVDLFRQMFVLNKDALLIKKDTDFIKKELKGLSNKVDLILEILNNLTIMVLDEHEIDDEDDEDNEYNIYDSDDSWVPEESTDEYEDDNWSDNPDES